MITVLPFVQLVVCNFGGLTFKTAEASPLSDDSRRTSHVLSADQKASIQYRQPLSPETDGPLSTICCSHRLQHVHCISQLACYASVPLCSVGQCERGVEKSMMKLATSNDL